LEGKNCDQDNLDKFPPILIALLKDHDLKEWWKGVVGLTFWICHEFSTTVFDGYLPSLK